MTDPAAVKSYIRFFIQHIYRKQTGLTPEEAHVISLLGSGDDDAVLKDS